jgi:uncharacterized repeat protein (TIGR03803 family)
MFNLLRFRVCHKLLAGPLLASALVAAPALAGTYTTLYQFTGGSDGATPLGALTYDHTGDLYGVTEQGDNLCPDGIDGIGCGTVYKLSPTGQQTTLVAFAGASNGAFPRSPLTLVDHILYGGAYYGGANDDGVLFSVHTDGANFKLLHTFDGSDGIGPDGPLIPGPAGAFYGITGAGGPRKHVQSGVLFELMPDGAYIQLHDFTGGSDGGGPISLTIDASGTLYGSTHDGASCTGERSCGVVFEYVPSTGTFTVLHQFLGAEGVAPLLGSIGPDGTLYGVTELGTGGINIGTLFELTPAGGAYSLTTLFQFQNNGVASGPGCEPSGGPILTPQGALIGATDQCQPSLYRYKFNHMKVLYSFSGAAQPAPPILDRGIIYGASSVGGFDQCFIGGRPVGGGCGFLYSFVQ